MAISSTVYSQNTKGDKPAVKQVQKIFSNAPIPRGNSKGSSKPKLRPREIRWKVRTINTTSARRATNNNPISQLRYAKIAPREIHRVGMPIGGRQIRALPSPEETERKRVYTRINNNTNPSPIPLKTEHGVPNDQVLVAAAKMRSPPKIVNSASIIPRSGNISHVTRRKKNVYWGKFRRGEKIITTDISGRRLRRKNFRSLAIGTSRPKNIYKGRQKNDAFQDSFKAEFLTENKSTQNTWHGDILGRDFRIRYPKNNQILSSGPLPHSSPLSITPYRMPTLANYQSRGFDQRSVGFSSIKNWRNENRLINNNGWPINGWPRGTDANINQFSKIGTGFRSNSGELWNNGQQPILNMRQRVYGAGHAPLNNPVREGYSSHIKLARTGEHESTTKQFLKIGTGFKSNSGELRNNGQQPILNMRQRVYGTGHAPLNNPVREGYSSHMKLAWADKHESTTIHAFNRVGFGFKSNEGELWNNKQRAIKTMTQRLRAPNPHPPVHKKLTDNSLGLKIENHHNNKSVSIKNEEIKNDRTFFTTIKLFWSKVLGRNNIQTKTDNKRLHYDKKERELWKDLYD